MRVIEVINRPAPTIERLVAGISCGLQHRLHVAGLIRKLEELIGNQEAAQVVERIQRKLWRP